MRMCLSLTAFAIAASLCLVSASSGGRNEPARSDTVASTQLFDPPRVITPDDTAAPAAEPYQSPGRRDAKPQHMEASEGKRRSPGKCGRCSEPSRPRFGGGGGPVPGYLFANFDDINTKVRQMGIADLSENVFIMGGKGYARMGNFIIGGAGYGGRTETSGIPDCCSRHAEVEIGYGGVIVGLSKTDLRYEATAGVLLGGGSIVIERRRNSRYVSGWDESWDLFNKDDPHSVATDDLNVTSSVKGSFLAIEPFIEFKFWFFPFMALDFSASYLRASIGSGQWKQDEVKIPDSPETNIGGPTLKIGLHFGV